MKHPMESELNAFGIKIPLSKLIGSTVICEVGEGFILSTIVSVSTVANDDGLLELCMAPSVYRGDDVVSVLFSKEREQYIRTKFFQDGEWCHGLHLCKAALVGLN